MILVVGGWVVVELVAVVVGSGRDEIENKIIIIF